MYSAAAIREMNLYAAIRSYELNEEPAQFFTEQQVRATTLTAFPDFACYRHPEGWRAVGRIQINRYHGLEELQDWVWDIVQHDDTAGFAIDETFGETIVYVTWFTQNDNIEVREHEEYDWYRKGFVITGDEYWECPECGSPVLNSETACSYGEYDNDGCGYDRRQEDLPTWEDVVVGYVYLPYPGKSRAFVEGAAASASWESDEDNPYDPFNNPDENQEWDDGWMTYDNDHPLPWVEAYLEGVEAHGNGEKEYENPYSGSLWFHRMTPTRSMCWTLKNSTPSSTMKPPSTGDGTGGGTTPTPTRAKTRNNPHQFHNGSSVQGGPLWYTGCAMKNLVNALVGLLQLIVASAEIVAAFFSTALSLAFAIVLLVLTGMAGLLVLAVLAVILSVIYSHA